MSLILAIETSADLASAALLRGDQLTSLQSAGVQTHSDTILPMVQQLLADAGASLADCAAVALGIGPGSFTGVRTACGVAQGLAFGADLPVVPVITLLAMAQACRERTGADDVLAIMDARMGEVYWAQYHFDSRQGSWQTVLAPALSTPQEVTPQTMPQATPHAVAQGSVIACGNGLAVYAGQFDAMAAIAAAGHADIVPHAGQIARLAAIELAQGRSVPLDQAQPFYLRNKIALTTAERAAKAAGAAA